MATKHPARKKAAAKKTAGRKQRATHASVAAMLDRAREVFESIQATERREARAPMLSAVVSATSAGRLGPLLATALHGLQRGAESTGVARMALDFSAAEEVAPEPMMPVAVAPPRVEPVPGEGWRSYKQRALDQLGPVAEQLRSSVGLQSAPLLSGNILQARALPGQIAEALQHENVRMIELDPLVIATLMDDAVGDIELPLARMRHPGLDGSGVRLAVLDSGIDVLHPWLQVADSVSTAGEDVAIPGRHGTHVAGSIASRDSVYGGVAPGVILLNVKVLDSLGRGQHTSIVAGIDEALDRNAQILSMSVGFNHLPTWSQNGHGWSCPDGRCPLCTAVNTAVIVEGVLAVVAAGNEHERAQFLRGAGMGGSFDTEIACPGQASGALTVGALTKQTFLTAPFSSRGPTAFGALKPDLGAPGVNITSSVPLRRGPNGQPVAGLTRGEMSASLSGTSMATPIVAGVAALVIQKRLAAGQSVTPADVRAEILGTLVRHLGAPPEEVGAGRLTVASL